MSTERTFENFYLWRCVLRRAYASGHDFQGILHARQPKMSHFVNFDYKFRPRC